MDIRKIKIRELTRSSPFKDYSGLITKDATLQDKFKVYREKIKQSMATRGFDPSKPIDVWKNFNIQQNIVVDGYTRLDIAEEVGLDEVYAALHDFASVEEALAYAIHNQEARRPSTDYTILIGVQMMDAYHKLKENEPTDRKPQTIKEVAKTLGVNRNTVEKARTIISDTERKKDKTIIEEVREGKKTINSAYNATMLERLQNYAKMKKDLGITAWKNPKDRSELAAKALIGDGTANRFDYVAARDLKTAQKVLKGDMTCNSAYKLLKSKEPPAGQKEAINKFLDTIRDLKCPICGGPAAKCIRWICNEKV
jgi:DNA-binding transcriptional regulator YhcF (GntR family)